MQITITKIYKSDKDKNGKPLVSKEGRPYTRLSIKTKEHGDKWLSGFVNKETMNWEEGDIVEVEIETKSGTDGREFLNFRCLNEMDRVWQMLYFLKKEIADIKRNFGEVPDEEVNIKLDEASEEIKDKDLPF